VISEKKNIRHPYISDETLCIDKTAFVDDVSDDCSGSDDGLFVRKVK